MRNVSSHLVCCIGTRTLQQVMCVQRFLLHLSLCSNVPSLLAAFAPQTVIDLAGALPTRCETCSLAVLFRPDICWVIIRLHAFSATKFIVCGKQRSEFVYVSDHFDIECCRVVCAEGQISYISRILQITVPWCMHKLKGFLQTIMD